MKIVTRYRAVLAYDGTHYLGFQRQAANAPTIQGALEAAVEQVTTQRVTVIGAGRTDTGVHASGQVIAFDVVWNHTPDDLLRALNATLPEDIALQTLEVTEADFHPRFDARSRTYEYTVLEAPVRQPFYQRYTWQVSLRQALDRSAMQAGAALLLGTHDFATFGRAPQGDNTVREVLCSEIVCDPLHEGLIRYRIEANAFLYRMVRRIVGALFRVGTGNLTVEEFAQALRAADGDWPNQTAPARGLCLVKVTY